MKVWTNFGDPQVNMNNVTIVQTYVRAYNHRKLSCQSELIKHCRHVPHPGLIRLYGTGKELNNLSIIDSEKKWTRENI
jgi:hypothetical protein